MIRTISSLRNFRALPRVTTLSRIPKAHQRQLFTIVDQATVKYRELLGMSRVKLNPGIALYIPLIHKMRVVDMREQSQFLKIEAYTSDNVPVNVTGSLFFRVTDAEKACYSVQDYISAVHAIGQSSARATIGRFEYDKITREKSAINAELCAIIDKTIDAWGIDCTRFEIQDFKPQSPEIARQLELQMEAERKRRENELVTQGKIRTAEGERDAVILKSQGELVSKKNLAEANFVLVQREADAKKYEIDLMTSAQTNQLSEIAKQFNGDIAKASQYILDQLRMKNLAQVASGPNNSTYFMPNDFAPFKVIADLVKKS